MDLNTALLNLSSNYYMVSMAYRDFLTIKDLKERGTLTTGSRRVDNIMMSQISTYNFNIATLSGYAVRHVHFRLMNYSEYTQVYRYCLDFLEALNKFIVEGTGRSIAKRIDDDDIGLIMKDGLYVEALCDYIYGEVAMNDMFSEKLEKAQRKKKSSLENIINRGYGAQVVHVEETYDEPLHRMVFRDSIPQELLFKHDNLLELSL